MEPQKLASLLNEPRLELYLKQLERQLDLAVSDSGQLLKPLKAAIHPAGKRLRPILTIYIASSRKSIDPKMIKAACAVEMVHLASLVHDDLVDNSKYRRGDLSLAGKYSAPIALLAGDYLIASACQLAAEVSQAVTQLIAETIASMAVGQASDKLKQSQALTLSPSYQKAITQKTASLFKSACQIGGLVASYSPAELKILGQFGQEFGRAYQILDDINDGDLPKKYTQKAILKAKSHSQAASRQAIQLGSKLQQLPSYYLNWALPAKKML